MNLTEQEKALLSQGKQQLRIVFLAMMVSVITFLVISKLIPIGEEPVTDLNPNLLLTVFIGIAVSLAFLAYYFRFIRFRKQSSRPVANKISQAVVSTAIQEYRTTCLVSLAFGQAIAGMGFAFFIASGNRFGFYSLLVISIATLVLCRPLNAELEGYVKFQQKKSMNHAAPSP